MKNFKLIAVLIGLLFSVNSWAALITMSDGDEVNYDSANVYELIGSLTLSDPMLTYGFNVPFGEVFYITATAPPTFDLFAALSTGPDFGGSPFQFPGDSDFDRWLLPAGTSYEFVFGVQLISTTVYGTSWITVSADVNDPNFIAAVGESGGVPVNIASTVPVPPAVWLFGSGLLGLVGAARRKKA